MNRFLTRLTCIALTMAALVLIAAPKARAQDDPRVSRIINSLKIITDRLDSLEDRLNQESLSRSRPSYAPSGTGSAMARTNTIHLVNETSATVTLAINSQTYRLAPYASANLNASAGTYRYRLMSGDTRWHSIALDDYESVTISISDGDDEP